MLYVYQYIGWVRTTAVVLRFGGKLSRIAKEIKIGIIRLNTSTYNIHKSSFYSAILLSIPVRVN